MSHLFLSDESSKLLLADELSSLLLAFPDAVASDTYFLGRNVALGSGNFQVLGAMVFEYTGSENAFMPWKHRRYRWRRR